MTSPAPANATAPTPPGAAADGANRPDSADYGEWFARLPVGVYAYRSLPDGTMRFDYVSPRFAAILGVDAAALLADIGSAFAAALDDDRAELLATIAEVTRSLAPFAWEGRFLRDGEIRWARLESHPTPLPDGGSLWHGILSDITDRKRAENALRESEARFRRLSTLSSDWYWEQDADLRFTFMSEGMYASTGLDRRSHVGQCRWDIPCSNMLPTDWEAHRALLLARQPFRDLELCRIGSDGKSNWASISGDPVFDERGAFCGYHGVGKDVTAQKNAELALAARERELDTIVNGVEAAISRYGCDQRYTFVNAKFAQAMGRPPEAILGRSAREIVGEAYYASVAPMIERALAGEVVRFERTYRDTGGTEHALALQYTPDRDAEGRVNGCIVISIDVTEQRRARDAQRISEEKFAKVFEICPEFMAISTLAEGRYLAVNEAYERNTGYRRDEVIGRTAIDVGFWADPDDRRRFTELLRRDGRVRQLEMQVRRKSGDIRICEVDAERLEVDGVDCVLSVTVDVTDIRMARQSLEESHQRLLTLIESLPDGVFFKDGEGRWQLINQLAARLFEVGDFPWRGMSERELATARPRFGALHEACDRTDEEAWQQRALHLSTEFIPVGDGSVHEFEVRKIPLFEADGRRRALIVIGRDVTEQRAAEARLRLLSTALNATANAVVITDVDGRIEWVNPAFETLTRYRADEALGRDPGELIAVPDHPPGLIADLWGTILDGRVWHGELVNRRKDGTRYHESQTITPVVDDHGTIRHFVAIKQDITERKLTELEVRRLNEALEERVRVRTAELQTTNQELESFSYSVSHDLRAPLRAIDGYVGLLMEEHSSTLPQEGRHFLERISKNARAMGALIDGLLNFSRLTRQPLERVRMDPTALVHEVLEEFAPAIRKSGTRVEVVPLPRCDASPMLLKQVFQNLVSNALKFSAPSSPPEIRIDARVVDGETVYGVADNGVGFDAAYANRLFGVFQRLHSREDFEGTGIGLALVRRIVERHGGRVWAESEPRQGARFYFTLGDPAADAGAEV